MSVVSQVIHGTEIRVPETLNRGRYRVETILAMGGQGYVLVAQDTRLANNRVLIKAPLYNLDLLSLGAYGFLNEKRKRYEAILYEISIARNLNELAQNVPRVVDYFEDDNLMLAGTYRTIGGQDTWKIGPSDETCRDLFVVYELLSAGAGRPRTLEDVIEERKGTLSEQFVLLMAKQIADVLKQLHNRINATSEDKADDPGLHQYYYLYQDLKPANILVTGEETGKHYFFLIDFGGVTRCDIRRLDNQWVTEVPPGAGAYTLGYAAPEIFQDQRHIDRRFDIFTLGATMFHTFTGEHPIKLMPDPTREGAPDFNFVKLNEYKILQDSGNPLIREIIFTATRPDPRKRYDSIEQMREDILLALGGS
jgi:serine/threonine protein kinase